MAAQSLDDDACRAWLPSAVYMKVREGQSAFLSELRPAASLFLRFGGVDFDGDAPSRFELDAFVRWVQTTAARQDGVVLQLTAGGNGLCFYIAFGAPIGHYDDAARAVRTALQLRSPPAEFRGVGDVGAGIAYGPMRAGAYGSAAQRAYTAMGDKTNLAARLMAAAASGMTLCDEGVYQAAREQFTFETLPPISVKGKSEAIAVYKAVAERGGSEAAARGSQSLLMDRLIPGQQLALKVASVIGRIFALETLRDVYPDETDRGNAAAHLESLASVRLIAPVADAGGRVYAFVDAATLEDVYAQMLFAQRRQLHRAVAEWHERAHAANLAPHYPVLARHWRAADEPARAIHYLEKAGELARQNGAYEEAQRYLRESLSMDATASVLSSDYGKS
jgi:hypothetical protein